MLIQDPPTNRVAEVLRRQTTVLDNMSIYTRRSRHKERPDEDKNRALVGGMMKETKGNQPIYHQDQNLLSMLDPGMKQKTGKRDKYLPDTRKRSDAIIQANKDVNLI